MPRTEFYFSVKMWEAILIELYNFIGIPIAALLGFVIGYERKLRHKEAGIGTHTVVCIGSALIMVVSKYGFSGEADAARVAAQIVSGIGFIGAGIIAYRQQKIHGLTTAAGVWATAGVGMAAGAGLYVIAVCSTVLIIAVQCLFHIPCKFFRSKSYYRLRIVFVQTADEADKIKEIFSVNHFHSLEMKREEDAVRCSIAILTATEYSSMQLTEIMKSNKFILTIITEDDE